MGQYWCATDYYHHGESPHLPGIDPSVTPRARWFWVFEQRLLVQDGERHTDLRLLLKWQQRTVCGKVTGARIAGERVARGARPGPRQGTEPLGARGMGHEGGSAPPRQPRTSGFDGGRHGRAGGLPGMTGPRSPLTRPRVAPAQPKRASDWGRQPRRPLCLGHFSDVQPAKAPLCPGLLKQCPGNIPQKSSRSQSSSWALLLRPRAAAALTGLVYEFSWHFWWWCAEQNAIQCVSAQFYWLCNFSNSWKMFCQ